MFNPLGQLGELKKMRDQAMQIQKALKEEKITVEKNGVRIVITGNQEFESIEVNGKSDKDVREALNEAIKKSQEAAARKMASMGGMGALGKMFGQ